MSVEKVFKITFLITAVSINNLTQPIQFYLKGGKESDIAKMNWQLVVYQFSHPFRI